MPIWKSGNNHPRAPRKCSPPGRAKQECEPRSVEGRHRPVRGVRCASLPSGTCSGHWCGPTLSKTVQREIDALTETDSRGASEQERIGRQVIGPAQFVAEKWIVLWRERYGQILGTGWYSRWRPPVLAATPVLTNIQHPTSNIQSNI